MSKYIDADKLKYFCRNNHFCERSGEYKCNGCTYYAISEKRVKELPTEDVAPIIHGYWITHTYNESNGCDCWGRPEYETIIENECSYCHSKIITSKIKLYNYCPNCGARMIEP